MSRQRSAGAQLKGLAAVPDSGNQKPGAHGDQPAFDGTIASACEAIGIRLEQMIEMMRWAKESDLRVAQLLDTWDALDPSERQARGAADAVCEQIGFARLELLRIVADVTCRIAMYKAQIIAALSLAEVVAKTVDLALNATNSKDRLAAQLALHKAMGFLPTPKGSQTTVGIIVQNAQTNLIAPSIVEAPRPEDTIRRLDNRFNESRRLPDTLASAPPEAAQLGSVDAFARRETRGQE